MKIYLDLNTMIYLQEERDAELTGLIEKINPSSIEFLFSPAHIEEVAAIVIHHKKSEDLAEERLSFLAKITNETALLPFPRREVDQNYYGGIYLSKESPSITYKRVVDQYDLNVIPEEHQKEKLKAGEKYEQETGETANKVNNSDAFLLIENVKAELHEIVNGVWSGLRGTFLEAYLPSVAPREEDMQFDFLREYFPLHEALVEKTFEYLEKIRFYPEGSEDYLSAVHDNTHAIYAAYCDIFVTNDKKLKKKAEAVFNWLKVKASVLNVKEFKEYLAQQ